MTTGLEPKHPSTGRSPRRWRAVATAAALCLVASFGTVVLSAAVAPTVAGAATACATQPGTVTYKTIATPSPTRPTALTVIESVTVSKLSGTCDGSTAKLVFEGNAAGDSGGAKTTLSTITSAKNPCDGATLSKATSVATGSITFTLCPTPGTAGSYVHVHDLTYLTMSIAGATVPIKSPTAATQSTGSGGGAGNNGSHSVTSATSSSSSLAFTGADIALMTGGGVLVVLLGLFLLLISRRHRSATGGDGQ